MQFEIARETAGYFSYDLKSKGIDEHNAAALEKQSESMKEMFGMSPIQMIKDFVHDHIGTSRDPEEELNRVHSSSNPLAASLLAAIGEEEFLMILQHGKDNPEAAKSALLRELIDEDSGGPAALKPEWSVFWGVFEPPKEVQDRLARFLDDAEKWIPVVDTALRKYLMENKDDMELDLSLIDILTTTVNNVSPSPYKEEMLVNLVFGPNWVSYCTLDLQSGEVDVYMNLEELEDENDFDFDFEDLGELDDDEDFGDGPLLKG